VGSNASAGGSTSNVAGDAANVIDGFSRNSTPKIMTKLCGILRTVGFLLCGSMCTCLSVVYGWDKPQEVYIYFVIGQCAGWYSSSIITFCLREQFHHRLQQKYSLPNCSSRGMQIGVWMYRVLESEEAENSPFRHSHSAYLNYSCLTLYPHYAPVPLELASQGCHSMCIGQRCRFGKHHSSLMRLVGGILISLETSITIILLFLF
jgi:hypothetical protein